MSRALLPWALLLASLAACGGAGGRSTEPAARAGDGFALRFGEGGHAAGLGLAFAPGGDLFLCGGAGGPLAGLEPRGRQDAFVLRLSPAGATRWAKRFGGGEGARATAVVALPDGAVAVAGTFSGRIRFGARELVARGSPDGFVLVLDESGGVRRATALPSTSYALPEAIVAGGGGSLAVAGSFAGTLLAGDRRLTSAGAQDAFVLALGAGGQVRWALRGGGPSVDLAAALAAHPEGGFALTGTFDGNADFGGATLESTDGSADVFLIRVGAGGAVAWARGFGGGGSDAGFALAAAPDGGLLLGGRYHGDAFFGGAPVTSEGGPDAFVAAYTPTGRQRWTRRLGGVGSDATVAAAAEGDRFVALGSFEGETVDSPGRLASEGAADLFLLSFGRDGDLVSAESFGGAADETPADVALAPGALAVTGSFAGALVLEGVELRARGARDAFVLRAPASAHE